MRSGIINAGASGDPVKCTAPFEEQIALALVSRSRAIIFEFVFSISSIAQR
jgi:hypothetical protein